LTSGSDGVTRDAVETPLIEAMRFGGASSFERHVLVRHRRARMSAIIVPILVGVVLLALQRRGRGQLVATDYAAVLGFVAAMIALLKFAGPALRSAVSVTCGLIIFVRTYLWHRRDIRAGRREPVWFGKH
jgi:hypothetical protein